MNALATPTEIGTGPLSRWSAAVYWAVMIELLVVLTMLPGVVAILLLDRSASNTPLVALCFVPAGPALSAAVYAWRDYLAATSAQRDLAPARHFWRGYRLNWLDVLRWWVPTLAVLALLGVNVQHAGSTVGQPWAFASLVIATGVLVWAITALVLTSLLAFRTRDVVRLAVYYVGAKPVMTLGNLAVVLVGTAIALLVSDRLLLLLASLVVAYLVRNGESMVEDATARFVAPSADATPTA